MSKREKSAHIKHMESLGYVFTKPKLPGVKDLRWLKGEHDEHGITLVSTKYDWVIMFTCVWPITREGAEHFKELLFLANEINRITTISRCVALTKKMMQKEDGKEYDAKNPDQLMLQSFYSGLYEEKSFNKFLDNWHSDIADVDYHPIYERFFRPDREMGGEA